MKFAPLLAVALVCNSLSLSLHAQKPESSSSTPGSTVLKDYDEAFGQVAERVMRSVVQKFSWHPARTGACLCP